MALHDNKDLDQERAVEKLLRVMPKKYTQLKITIETLLDFQVLTIEGDRETKDGGQSRRVYVRAHLCQWEAHAHGGAVARAAEEERRERLWLDELV
jgi:hypothetical protein